MRLKDRVVYVRSALISIPSLRLTFVEDSMFIVTCQSSNRLCDSLAASSLLLSFHRVHAEKSELPTSTQRDPALDEIENTIISLSDKRIERHLHRFQSLLNEEISASSNGYTIQKPRAYC